eukprot:768456-Hanusia_phi.AAC.2
MILVSESGDELVRQEEDKHSCQPQPLKPHKYPPTSSTSQKRQPKLPGARHVKVRLRARVRDRRLWETRS